MHYVIAEHRTMQKARRVQLVSMALVLAERGQAGTRCFVLPTRCSNISAKSSACTPAKHGCCMKDAW
jgi:hypothetical protein